MFAHIKSLHISLNTAHSACKPSTFISSLSICHTSPHPSHSVHPKDCTNPHCVSYPSATLRTSISPSSTPSSPDYADFLSSSLRFQSHMSTHCTQALYIFFMCYDAPWAVKIGDNSLTVALATSSCTKCVAQIAELGSTFQLNIGFNHNFLQQDWLDMISLQASPALEINITLAQSRNPM